MHTIYIHYTIYKKKQIETCVEKEKLCLKYQTWENKKNWKVNFINQNFESVGSWCSRDVARNYKGGAVEPDPGIYFEVKSSSSIECWGRSPNRGREAPDKCPNRSPRINEGGVLGRGLGEPLPRKFKKNRTLNHALWYIFGTNIWNKWHHALFENMFDCPHSWNNIEYLMSGNCLNFADLKNLIVSEGLGDGVPRSWSHLDDEVAIQSFLGHVWSPYNFLLNLFPEHIFSHSCKNQYQMTGMREIQFYKILKLGLGTSWRSLRPPETRAF